MGAVYLATHTKLHKRVAVKVLRREARRDPRPGRAVPREARAASASGTRTSSTSPTSAPPPTGAVFFVMEFLGTARRWPS